MSWVCQRRKVCEAFSKRLLDAIYQRKDFRNISVQVADSRHSTGSIVVWIGLLEKYYKRRLSKEIDRLSAITSPAHEMLPFLGVENDVLD